ncbi:adenosine deaminase-like protein [Globomyces pollinis-pini]|nr:adenosine deaminase-like protein [Globomyces pollinis-pini]
MSDLREFCEKLPKVELHAHLNGSLSHAIILELIALKGDNALLEEYEEFKKRELVELSDFFLLFGFIYKLAVTTDAVTLMTKRVIEEFYSDGCLYLELRSTPRASANMTKPDYINAMLLGVQQASESCPQITVRLIVSIDRRNTLDESLDTLNCVELVDHKGLIVGIDLCGDPRTFAETMIQPLEKAKQMGLKVTIHTAELPDNDGETTSIIELIPNRLGHATFLNPDHCQFVADKQIPIEICVSSNVLGKTVASIEQHHFYEWYVKKHPLILCTDDVGVFESKLSNEYFIVAEAFNLDKHQLYELSKATIDNIFAEENIKSTLRTSWNDFENNNLL